MFRSGGEDASGRTTSMRGVAGLHRLGTYEAQRSQLESHRLKQMASDRIRMGLRGPVRRVRIWRSGQAVSTTPATDLRFDSDGRLVRVLVEGREQPSRGQSSIVRRDDDTGFIVESVVGLSLYHPPLLGPTLWLSTCGAARARTIVDREDDPIATVFENSEGAEIARSSYQYDRSKRLVRVVQNLDQGAIAAATSEKGPDLNTLAVVLAVVLDYDDEGRLTRMEVHLDGSVAEAIRYSYNTMGDVAAEAREGEPAARWSYAYDGFGNWTSRLRDPPETGSADERRTLDYW